MSARDTTVVQQLRITVVKDRIDRALDAGDRRRFTQLSQLLRDLKRQSQDQTTG